MTLLSYNQLSRVMQIIEEKVVKKAVIETQLSTESREDVINGFLDQLLNLKDELVSLTKSYDRTNKILLEFMIQQNSAPGSEDLYQTLKLTNKIGLEFLSKLKKSKVYTGVKSTIVNLEVAIRNFQENYEDYSLRVHPDAELNDLLNEIEFSK